MKKTKKALASLAIAGMSLSMIPFNVFAASTVPTRIAGNTAEQTAVAIADQTGYTGAAILASSTSYGMVDALTAGPLAASLKAPILLTGAGTTLDAATKAELTKLAVKTVYVTSGTAVIKQGVIDELKAMGIEVVALGGIDRAETSVNIAKKMTGVTKVAVANTVVDALSIAAVASAANQPILLTDRDALPASVASYLASAGVTASDVIGGTGVISDAVKAGLPSATRHAGMTAYDTNNQVIQDFAAALAFDNVYVANGVTGIDALAGAPLAAQTKSPIVLTDGKTVPAVAQFTYSKATVGAVVTALGGEFVVPETVRDGVAKGQVTPDSNVLQIVSVSALDDSNKYLEIVFSKPVIGLQASDVTVKNADTLARFGVKEVQMSSNNLTATIELYAAEDAPEVLEYLQDYTVTVNANGTILTTNFNRPYSLKVRVQDINVGDKEIVVKADTKYGTEVTLEVPDGTKFDYQGALGELVQVWYNGDNELVNYKILSTTAKYDSIEVTDVDEIKLLGEDKKYDISDAEHTEVNKEKFAFYVDGEEVDIDDMDDYVDKKYNFAKVGFDTSGDVEFISAYALKDVVLFDSVDDEEVVGIDGSSGFDASDATIVKDGKVIGLDDLEKGDLIFYNEDADDEDGYAEVLNNKIASGEIEEVYDTSIEVDGEVYDYIHDGDVFEYENGRAVYINEDGEVDDVDDDVAEELQAAGDVALYADYAGNLIYISGDLADVESNTKVAVLTDSILGYSTSRDKIEIEALTQDEEELSFDMDLEDLDTITVNGIEHDIDTGADSDWTAVLTGGTGTTADPYTIIRLTDNSDLTPTIAEGSQVDISLDKDDVDAEADAGSLVKLHLDDNGNLEEIEFFNGTNETKTMGLEAGDKYLAGNKMTSSTLLFDATEDGVDTDADDYEVIAFGDYEGEEITRGNYILNDDGDEVVAVWFDKSEGSDFTYDEAVVTKVLRNTDKEVNSITVYAGGKLQTYKVDDFNDSSDIKKGSVVILEFDEDNNTLVKRIATDDHDITYDGSAQYDLRVKTGASVGKNDVNVGDKQVKTSKGTYKLADNGLVLDISDTSDISVESLSDLREETNVTVVLDSTNTSYAKFFLIGADAGDDDDDEDAGDTVSYVISSYSSGFGRLSLEDINGIKTDFLVSSFDSVSFNAEEVSVAQMKAWLAQSTVADMFVEVTDNELVVLSDEAEALYGAIADASALTEAHYTVATWTDLTDALALPEATDVNMTTKTADINTAIDALVMKISGFTALADFDAGQEAVDALANATAVEAALPGTVEATLADGTKVDLDVTSWTDTDTYDVVAGSYTFTAVVDVPAEYDLNGKSITVEVVVAP